MYKATTTPLVATMELGSASQGQVFYCKNVNVCIASASCRQTSLHAYSNSPKHKHSVLILTVHFVEQQMHSYSSESWSFKTK